MSKLKHPVFVMMPEMQHERIKEFIECTKQTVETASIESDSLIIFLPFGCQVIEPVGSDIFCELMKKIDGLIDSNMVILDALLDENEINSYEEEDKSTGMGTSKGGVIG